MIPRGKLFIALFVSFSACFQEKEPWIHKPFDEWPQIALVNDVLYKNGDKHADPTITYAATGFLLDTGKDTLAVTVKHVLFAARNKASDKVYINDHLKKWIMHPKGNPADSVVIDRLINEDKSENLWDGENGALQRDWIVFSTKYISPGIHPLKLGNHSTKVGDTVFIIGNPYRFDKTVTAKGGIIRIEGNHLFVDWPDLNKAFLGGASGSPIIDRNGKLIGIFSNSQSDPKTGTYTSIINSTEYLKRILNGTVPLNVNKKSLSGFLDSLVQNTTMEKALRLFDQLVKNPGLNFSYELTYSNKGAMFKTGELLIDHERTNDAVRYFVYFTNLYPSNMHFHMGLARAYLQNDQKPKAIQALETGLEKIYEEDKAELEKLLMEIENK